MGDVLADRPEVDALFTGDPSEFVAARTRLAKELKAAGEGEAAAAVAALRKPTKVAWALNQVARLHADAMTELRDAGAELQERQAAALSGGGAEALREATRRRRDLIRALVAEVVSLVGDTHRYEAAATFEAASVDGSVADRLAAGRLSTAVERPGDLGFVGVAAPPPRRGVTRRRAPAGADAPGGASTQRSPRRTTGGADRAEGGARPTSTDRPGAERRRISRLERQLTDAEDAAADAERVLRHAERDRAAAADALAAARAELDQAETRLARARLSHDEARRAVDSRRGELDDARRT